MIRKAVFAALLLAAFPAKADDAMMAAANNFYGLVTGKGFSSVGIPQPGARAQLAPLLTARLSQALGAASSAQARFMAKNKGAPPLLEGDIFSSLFEGPTAWKVGACSGNSSTARCSIALTRQDPGKPAVTWTDTLVLANQGGWKVEDLAYDANFSFGNTGTLSQMLKMAQSEAP